MKYILNNPAKDIDKYLYTSMFEFFSEDLFYDIYLPADINLSNLYSTLKDELKDKINGQAGDGA